MSENEIFGTGGTSRRGFLKKAVIAGAIAVPAVSTFSLLAGSTTGAQPIGSNTGGGSNVIDDGSNSGGGSNVIDDGSNSGGGSNVDDGGSSSGGTTGGGTNTSGGTNDGGTNTDRGTTPVVVSPTFTG
jgi:hypothetical protein